MFSSPPGSTRAAAPLESLRPCDAGSWRWSGTPPPAAYPLVVECPTIRWDSARSQDEIVAQIEARAAHGPLYVIGEALSYIDLSALPQPHTVLMTVYRPGRQTSVSLYRIEQGATRPAAP